MFTILKNLFLGTSDVPARLEDSPASINTVATIYAEGYPPFNISDHMIVENGLPVPDWSVVQEWIGSINDVNVQGQVWADTELAWLSHLRMALGDNYRVSKLEKVVLVSSFDTRSAKVTLSFMASSLQRIVKTLGRLSSVPELGYDILIAFDDDDTYYRYVSRYYPEEGEFSLSSGMHIAAGCGHFVTTKLEMSLIEPVIVHEMTHSCLAHLPIPAWVNEGLAVNTENSLCGHYSDGINAQERHEQHLKYWGESEIQQFWSGESFLRIDQGSPLSYDLARILVAQLAKNWSDFEFFALDANLNDSGQASAQHTYSVTLGSLVCALFDREYDSSWEPRPEIWSNPPERGAF